MKRTGARVLRMTLLLLAVVPVVCADPPALITISDPKVFGSASRAPVRFTHKDHMSIDGVSCLTCHHVFKDGKNILDPRTIKEGDPSLQCAACHVKPRDLEAAFHQLCITCHDTAKRQGKVTGPRTCGECHAWSR